MRRILPVVMATVGCSSMLHAQGVTASIDLGAATAVVEALSNPRLTMDDALKVARLPGNQGLTRKARSYGRTATDELFAKALVAAAQQDAKAVDTSGFQFGTVRGKTAQTKRAIAAFRDPKLSLVDKVKARIALFTPANVSGTVTGYVVAGGTSGGFAFGEPQFYLNIDRYPSAALASTIMSHELFHAVQALAQSQAKVSPDAVKCIAAMPNASDVASFFDSLSAEGTASYVGDVLALPSPGVDEPAAKERARFARNVGMVGRSITQLELSIHGLTTGAAVSPDEIYELGFYGDEAMYALGYVMARAIAKEEGNAAIGALIGQSGAAIVNRYVHLRGYAKSEDMPELKPHTIDWAAKLSRCYSATIDGGFDIAK
jgi:hypothetical protein